MRTAMLGLAMIAAACGGSDGAWAQTCADQHKACLARGHTVAECQASTDRCLKTGRWIGLAGVEYPVQRKK